MGFLNKKIAVAYTFQTDVYEPWFSGDVTVNSNVEVDASKNGGIFSVDLSDDMIYIDFNDAGMFTTYEPNGLRFTDKQDNVAAIVGVKLYTNVTGLALSDIEWSADEIFIDWHGTSFTSKSYVEIIPTFDTLLVSGNANRNVLIGTDADEIIDGGRGADKMTGGGGGDTFVFAAHDSAAIKSRADVITDFRARQNDLVDLSEIDADTSARGMQDFTYIRHRAFSDHAGELRIERSGHDRYLSGDTDGDGKADFYIHLEWCGRLTTNQLCL